MKYISEFSRKYYDRSDHNEGKILHLGGRISGSIRLALIDNCRVIFVQLSIIQLSITISNTVNSKWPNG